PQTPRPPSHTANGPHQWFGTSFQLVMSWYARAPTMPAATPQTATRRTRSGSPPQLFQRYHVSAMHATIASSSISPYMWIERPKTSNVPVCGEGMEAKSASTRDAFCRRVLVPAPLEQNRERQLSEASLADAAWRPRRLGRCG